MSWLIRKLFLVKEIVSQEGKLHFQRFLLLATPWFNIYIHHILRSDEEAHFHDHPWSFFSLILRGAYREIFSTASNPLRVQSSTYGHGRRLIHHYYDDAHKITLLTPDVWTLVFTYGKWRPWGYQTSEGWIESQSYRQLKQQGKLPQ